MKSWVTVPKFKREYFKLLNGENFTSTWIALQRPYTLIISREKNFIREFWVLSHTAGLLATVAKTMAKVTLDVRDAKRRTTSLNNMDGRIYSNYICI